MNRNCLFSFLAMFREFWPFLDDLLKHQASQYLAAWAFLTWMWIFLHIFGILQNSEGESESYLQISETHRTDEAGEKRRRPVDYWWINCAVMCFTESNELIHSLFCESSHGGDVSLHILKQLKWSWRQDLEDNIQNI